MRQIFRWLCHFSTTVLVSTNKVGNTLSIWLAPSNYWHFFTWNKKPNWIESLQSTNSTMKMKFDLKDSEQRIQFRYLVQLKIPLWIIASSELKQKLFRISLSGWNKELREFWVAFQWNLFHKMLHLWNVIS